LQYSPFVFIVIPLQLLAYDVAVIGSWDVDKKKSWLPMCQIKVKYC